MEAISAWDVLCTAVVTCLIVVYFVAAVKILQRMGYSAWWSVLAVVPVANVVGLWLLSKARWPKLMRRT